MRTQTEFVEPGYRDVLAWGQRSEVQRWLEQVSAAEDLVALTPPRPHEGGVAVRARFRQHRQVPSPRPAYRTVQRPEWSLSLRWSSELTRPLIVAAATVGGLAGLAWVAVQVIKGAGVWISSQAWWLIPVCVLALVATGAWLTRDRGSKGCSGMAHHCPRCPDH